MSRFILSLSLLAILATGCDDQQSGSQAYHQSAASAKPVVAVVPVIDNTKDARSWNISDELTTALYSRLSQDNRFYLVDLSEVRAKTKKLHDNQNPFGTEFSWIKKVFQGDEFVAFAELIEHEEILRQDRKKSIDPKTCAADLKMGMRLRVFDLRGKEPKIVLQEMIHNTHFVPRQYTKMNFQQPSWGEDSFSFSPVGLAHGDFTKEIAQRLEDYIALHAQN